MARKGKRREGKGRGSEHKESIEETSLIGWEPGSEQLPAVVSDLELEEAQVAWGQLRFWMEDEDNDHTRGGTDGDGGGNARRSAAGRSLGSPAALRRAWETPTGEQTNQAVTHTLRMRAAWCGAGVSGDQPAGPGSAQIRKSAHANVTGRRNSEPRHSAIPLMSPGRKIIPPPMRRFSFVFHEKTSM